MSSYVCTGLPFKPTPTLNGVNDYINAIGVLTARDDRPSQENFPIDVTLINGRFGLYNPPENAGDEPQRIPVTEATAHKPPPEPEEDESPYITPEPFDYDGDDKDDHVSEVGSLSKDYLEDVDAQTREKLYGVWFSKPDDATEGEGGVLAVIKMSAIPGQLSS